MLTASETSLLLQGPLARRGMGLLGWEPQQDVMCRVWGAVEALWC